MPRKSNLQSALNELLNFKSICHSPNGWTNGELGLMWMKKDFDPTTKDKATGTTQVLLMDGHSSHYTYELLDYAQKNNITILGYPPHCMHVLQGLDVICFAKMKTEFHQEIRAFEELTHCTMTKCDFTGVFS